jgi:regulator of cell morphogenesis and NO signaling
MKYQESTIIGEIVATDYRAAKVFKKWNIDFCCNGGRTIDAACKESGVPSDKVVQEVNDILQVERVGETNFKDWPLDLLVDYIEKKHHRYVENASIEIKAYLQKICDVHGDRHPELFEIKEEFEASSGELAIHMKKEELVLFPYVRKLVSSANTGQPITAPGFGTATNPISQMQHEHNDEGERFRRIRTKSNDYTVPEDGCNTYRVTFALLEEFETDLHLHIHLENNIVFPKVVELEQQLLPS